MILSSGIALRKALRDRLLGNAALMARLAAAPPPASRHRSKLQPKQNGQK